MITNHLCDESADECHADAEDEQAPKQRPIYGLEVDKHVCHKETDHAKDAAGCPHYMAAWIFGGRAEELAS